jgi:hypothetical protein
MTQEFPQACLSPPQDERLYASWRREISRGEAKALSDEPIWSPIGHADLASWPADSQQLSRRLLLVWGKHGAEAGQDHAERGIWEVQVLSVALQRGDRKALNPGALAPPLQEGPDEIDASHVAPASDGRQRIQRFLS